MTYSETLEFLYAQLPMYQRQGAPAMKKDLENTRKLLAAIDNPEQQLRCIHVGGTNGKGTVTHLIAAALQKAGLRVGCYTSPHYLDFRERIKINGEFIPEDEVVDFVARMRPTIDAVQPSFFELTVAMAFDFFASRRVECCVIEVGLGGRLDSTNVIDPLLSVITNIGYDHQQFLGETLPEIAGEKAGIIKPGRPVVIGLRQEETEAIFVEKARSVEAPIHFAEDLLPKFAPFASDVGGPFATENQRTALAALTLLKDILPALRAKPAGQSARPPSILARESWTSVGPATYYIGRWQQLDAGPPLVMADSAHNGEGLVPVLYRLEQMRAVAGGRLHVVMGVVNDKDLSRALPLFPRSAAYYFAKADIPRGLPAEALRAAAAGHRLVGEAHASVAAALAAARAAAAPNDLVFVGGSIFTVAEALATV